MPRWALVLLVLVAALATTSLPLHKVEPDEDTHNEVLLRRVRGGRWEVWYGPTRHTREQFPTLEVVPFESRAAEVRERYAEMRRRGEGDRAQIEATERQELASWRRLEAPLRVGLRADALLPALRRIMVMRRRASLGPRVNVRMEYLPDDPYLVGEGPTWALRVAGFEVEEWILSSRGRRQSARMMGLAHPLNPHSVTVPRPTYRALFLHLRSDESGQLAVRAVLWVIPGRRTPRSNGNGEVPGAFEGGIDVPLDRDGTPRDLSTLTSALASVRDDGRSHLQLDVSVLYPQESSWLSARTLIDLLAGLRSMPGFHLNCSFPNSPSQYWDRVGFGTPVVPSSPTTSAGDE